MGWRSPSSAGCILLQMLYMTNTHSVSPAHPFFDNDTTPEIIQAISLAQQALARNSRLLTDVVITPVGGPGTKTLLYECAAMAIMASRVGRVRPDRPTLGCGRQPDHVSGLEARFTAEVARAAAGMSRADADVIVRSLVALYQARSGQAARSASRSPRCTIWSRSSRGRRGWRHTKRSKASSRQLGLPLA